MRNNGQDIENHFIELHNGVHLLSREASSWYQALWTGYT